MEKYLVNLNESGRFVVVLKDSLNGHIKKMEKLKTAGQQITYEMEAENLEAAMEKATKDIFEVVRTIKGLSK